MHVRLMHEVTSSIVSIQHVAEVVQTDDYTDYCMHALHAHTLLITKSKRSQAAT